MRRSFTIWVRTMAITLVIAMIYYFAGYKLVYSFVIHGAKQEASFAIRHNAALSDITMSESAYNHIKWTDKGKEFSLKGELYDVVNIQKSGDTYILKVYMDKNETRWAKAMHDVVKFLFPSPNSQKNNCAEGLLSAFQKEYTPLQKVEIGFIPEIKDIYYPERTAAPSRLLVKPVWHPPAISC